MADFPRYPNHSGSGTPPGSSNNSGNKGSFGPSSRQPGSGYSKGDFGSFSKAGSRSSLEHTAEVSRQIEESIRKKADSTQFELHIQDEEFQKIPDVQSTGSRRAVTGPPPFQSSSRMPPGGPPQRRPNGAGGARNGGASPPAPNRGGQKGAPQKRKRKKGGGYFSSLIYVLCVVGVSILLSIFLVQSMQDYLGLLKTGDPVVVEIPENASASQVARLLKQNKVISQSLTFVLYANLKDKGNSFKAGAHEMDPTDSYDGMFRELTRDPNATEDDEDVVSLTFLEGRSIREIGKQLEKSGVCSGEDFEKALEKFYTDNSYEWMEQIPKNENRYLTLEGYVFPSTYKFYKDSKPTAVARKFLDAFTDNVYTPYKDVIAQKGLTLDGVLTMASLVEKEGSGHIEDMYNISAIFYNRLNNSSVYPKLQSDVTINYVMNNIYGYETDQAKYDAYAAAYNTYRCNGLPAGPVANPGTDAIDAAIYPDMETNAGVYFFVTDVNTKFYYSKTFKEHQAKCAVAAKVTNEENPDGKIGGIATVDG